MLQNESSEVLHHSDIYLCIYMNSLSKPPSDQDILNGLNRAKKCLGVITGSFSPYTNFGCERITFIYSFNFHYKKPSVN